MIPWACPVMYLVCTHPVLPSKIHRILDLESHVALIETGSGLGTCVTDTPLLPLSLRNLILLKLSTAPHHQGNPIHNLYDFDDQEDSRVLETQPVTAGAVRRTWRFQRPLCVGGISTLQPPRLPLCLPTPTLLK